MPTPDDLPNQDLLSQAAQCFRLARDIGDPLTQMRLEALGLEYQAKANAMDAEPLTDTKNDQNP